VISDANNSVVATISVAQYPSGVAYDSAKGEVFVVSSDYPNSTVSVISDSNNSVVAKITVGRQGGAVAYDSKMGRVYVQTGDGIQMISDDTNKVVGTISLSVGDINSMAYDSGKGEIFIAGDSGVSVISDSSNKVVANVPVGDSPYGLAYDPAKNEVFVSNAGDGTLSVISDASDTTTTTSTSSSTTTTTTASTSPSTTTTTTAHSSTTSTSTSGSNGGGVPEFPYQLVTAAAFTAILVLSFLVIRSRTLPKTPVVGRNQSHSTNQLFSTT